MVLSFCSVSHFFVCSFHLKDLTFLNGPWYPLLSGDMTKWRQDLYRYNIKSFSKFDCVYYFLTLHCIVLVETKLENRFFFLSDDLTARPDRVSSHPWSYVLSQENQTFVTGSSYGDNRLHCLHCSEEDMIESQPCMFAGLDTKTDIAGKQTTRLSLDHLFLASKTTTRNDVWDGFLLVKKFFSSQRL